MNLRETMQCKLFHRVVVPRMCPAPRARDTPRPISQKTSKYAEDGSVGAELRRRVEVRLELQGATHNLGQPRIYVGTSEHSSTPPTINTNWESHIFCVLEPSKSQYLMVLEEVCRFHND